MIAIVLALAIQANDHPVAAGDTGGKANIWGGREATSMWSEPPMPEYPEQLLLRGVSIAARVVVQCDVGAQGVPANCGIIEETPEGMGFWQAAMNSMDHAHFSPALEGRKIRLTLRFGTLLSDNP